MCQRFGAACSATNGCWNFKVLYINDSLLLVQKCAISVILGFELHLFISWQREGDRVLWLTPYTLTLLVTRPNTVGTTEYRWKLPGSLAKISQFLVSSCFRYFMLITKSQIAHIYLVTWPNNLRESKFITISFQMKQSEINKQTKIPANIKGGKEINLERKPHFPRLKSTVYRWSLKSNCHWLTCPHSSIYFIKWNKNLQCIDLIQI